MAVNIGSSGAGAIFVGDRPVSTVYVGDTKVWPPEIVVVPVETFDAEAHTISYSGSVTELGVETAAAAVLLSEAKASAVGTVTPIPYNVTGTVSAKSTTAGWISGFGGIRGRAFSYCDVDSAFQAELKGQTVSSTPATPGSWFPVPPWVEGVDVIALGAGSGGNGWGVDAFLQEGWGGGAGKWGSTQVILRNLLTTAGLSRTDHTIEYRYTPGAGGAGMGKSSTFEIRAVPIGGGTPTILSTTTGLPGPQKVPGGGNTGETVTPKNFDLNGFVAVGGAGGIYGTDQGTGIHNGAWPGGGAAGQKVGGWSGTGANGALWWRMYSGADISQQAFLEPTPAGVWQSVTIPLNTVQFDVAAVGGGGGGNAGAPLAPISGAGGLGGSWVGSGYGDGISVEQLYAQAGITASSVQELLFEYQVGAGGARGTGAAAGNGGASRFRLRAKVGGAYRDLIPEKVANGGLGGGQPGTPLANPTGGEATGGNVNGREHRLRVLGRAFNLQGGKNTVGGFEGPPGDRPGGGGAGGAGFGNFWGGEGAAGGVFLVYGAVEAVNKIQIFECLGTLDNSNSSFVSRHADSNYFDHTIIKGYANTLLPFGGPQDNLANSVAGGVQQVVKQINAFGANSPFVLIGTSQGAQIMGTVWRDYVRNNPTLAARCKGVILMGNPIREQGRAFPGCNPIPEGHGIATADLRLTGTTNLVWEFAAPGDPVCTNLTSFTGGNAIGDAVEAGYASLWVMYSIVDVIFLAINVIGVINMLSGMAANHNNYGYNPGSEPADMSNPFKPIAGDSRPGWKIIVDHLNSTVGPSATYRGTYMRDGSFRQDQRAYVHAVSEIRSETTATVEVL